MYATWQSSTVYIKVVLFEGLRPNLDIDQYGLGFDSNQTELLSHGLTVYRLQQILMVWFDLDY